MNVKICLIVFLSALGVFIVGAIIGNILESKGTVSAETIGPKGVTGIKVAALALFCVMIFAFVPLAVRFFISMQIKIGNGEFFLIRFFQAHEQAIVYSGWILIVAGFGIIFFLGKDDILKNLR